jgi:cellulose biosynthesis protein BcsQ
MFQTVWKTCRLSAVLGALAVASSLSLVPVQPSFAQVRALPDFTDLVEQLGLSGLLV